MVGLIYETSFCYPSLLQPSHRLPGICRLVNEPVVVRVYIRVPCGERLTNLPRCAILSGSRFRLEIIFPLARWLCWRQRPASSWKKFYGSSDLVYIPNLSLIVWFSRLYFHSCQILNMLPKFLCFLVISFCFLFFSTSRRDRTIMHISCLCTNMAE